MLVFAQTVQLVTGGLDVILRQEASLTRRLYQWLLGSKVSAIMLCSRLWRVRLITAHGVRVASQDSGKLPEHSVKLLELTMLQLISWDGQGEKAAVAAVARAERRHAAGFASVGAAAARAQAGAGAAQDEGKGERKGAGGGGKGGLESKESDGKSLASYRCVSLCLPAWVPLCLVVATTRTTRRPSHSILFRRCWSAKRFATPTSSTWVVELPWSSRGCSLT